MKDRTDYAQNPDKTEKGELVSSYQCSPITVDEEFMLTKKLYEQVTGRSQKSNVIAYQIRQSGPVRSQLKKQIASATNWPPDF